MGGGAVNLAFVEVLLVTVIVFNVPQCGVIVGRRDPGDYLSSEASTVEAACNLLT